MYFFNPTLNERINATLAYNLYGVTNNNAAEKGWFPLDLTSPGYNKLTKGIKDNGTISAANGNGYVVDWAVVDLSLETKLANVTREFDKQLEVYFDKVAKVKNYTDRITCTLRAGLTNSPFQAEGVAFGTWMDNCYAALYSAIGEIKEGTRAVPETFEDLKAVLPIPPWELPVEKNNLGRPF